MTKTAPLGLYAYPWDVIDEGPDTVLEAVEQADLNTLYITTWYHSGCSFFRTTHGGACIFPNLARCILVPVLGTRDIHLLRRSVHLLTIGPCSGSNLRWPQATAASR